MKGVFIMLVRSFAGGVVFSGDRVLLIKNEKDEWRLPRGKMRDGELPSEVALKKIKENSGVQAEIISADGQTNYEYYPVTQRNLYCNKITWYIMKSLNENDNTLKSNNLESGSFFKIDEAMNMIGYSHDRSLLNLSFRKFKQLV
jgi:hypothetical protein